MLKLEKRHRGLFLAILILVLVVVSFWNLDVLGGVVTAVATGFIAYFTKTLWRTNENQLRHAREVERAYLAGGGDCEVAPNGARFFRVEVGNHGKTPAFLSAYAIHFSTLAEVQKGPKPVRRHTHSDQFPPGERHRPVGSPLPITSSAADVVYGAFWYRDIWRDPHCYRFILRIGKDGHTYSDVTGVDDRYRKWT